MLLCGLTAGIIDNARIKIVFSYLIAQVGEINNMMYRTVRADIQSGHTRVYCYSVRGVT